MKHSLKIVGLLLGMFFLTQLIGIGVIDTYSPEITQVINPETGELVNKTSYNLPFGTDPPSELPSKTALIFSFMFAIIFAVAIMLLLMKYKAELILKLWFFFVMALALGITFNAILLKTNFTFTSYFPYIALLLAFPLAFVKIFKRHILVHNLTELMIYPGIAAIFVPLLNIWTVMLLLIFISLYDMYAVWHSGFMQKMAKYQINKLKIFAGFFIPYLGAKEKKLVEKYKTYKKPPQNKKIKVNVAILGGGDVVFPIILAGVVLRQMGILSALIISIGATIALAALFYASKKGKFYPAMPFISAGCFLALGLVYLI